MRHENIIKLHDDRSGDAVNGLCFHHKRPWIVAGLSSGMIQIWNYYTHALVSEFPGHNGPVQSVHFNISSPLLASGGCDGKIKVWDYDEDICSVRSTFTLEGHSASVNDAQFHLELPWIVSASDDCTVRLWNWNSRNCIAVLTKHSGAATSSSFHPRKDLILSSSLDRTLCVWDISGLRENSVSCVDDIKKSKLGHHFAFLSRLSKKRNGVRLRQVLEGHASGVVQAIFHPTLPMIFSASDDCSVYWWKIEETQGTSKPQIIHRQSKEVSRLAYSTKLNSLFSTPDDEMMFVFDANSIPGRRNAEFFIHQKNVLNLCSHPTKNLFAFGRTDGLLVCRRMSEPPAFYEFNDTLYYLKDKVLWSYDYSNKKEAHIVLGPIDDLPDRSSWPIVVTLSCSPQGDTALICFDSEGYRMVRLQGNKKHAIAAKGNALSSVFLAPDRFAVLVRSGEEKILSLRTLSNEVVRECVLPGDIVAMSSYSGLGNCLLLLAKDRVVMFDLQQLVIVSELVISSVCKVFWMGGVDNKKLVVALVGKYFIVMANRKLQRFWTFTEHTTIESGMWDHENFGVFIFKTWKHIKYVILSGEFGKIMEYIEPLFITRISGSTIYGLDEDGEVRAVHVDASEYIMKSSVFNKDYMKQCCLCLC